MCLLYLYRDCNKRFTRSDHLNKHRKTHEMRHSADLPLCRLIGGGRNRGGAGGGGAGGGGPFDRLQHVGHRKQTTKDLQRRLAFSKILHPLANDTRTRKRLISEEFDCERVNNKTVDSVESDNLSNSSSASCGGDDSETEDVDVD